jgi:hypothetical protein
MGPLLDRVRVGARTRVAPTGNGRHRPVVSRPGRAGKPADPRKGTAKKLLVRLTVLGLAAFGARTLFERLRPRVSGAPGTGSIVGDTLSPAFREATTSVRNASTHAVHEMADATKQAAEELKDAAAGTAATPATGSEHQPSVPTAPSAPGDHQLSAMATQDLGSGDGGHSPS